MKKNDLIGIFLDLLFAILDGRQKRFEQIEMWFFIEIDWKMLVE